MDASEQINIRVGRSDHNDVTVSHPSVSSQHCTITFANGRWFIEDLKSTNGTFINGVRVNNEALNNGDKVLLGLVGFRFVDGALKLEATHSDSPSPTSVQAEVEPPNRSPQAFAFLSILVLGLIGIIVVIAGRAEDPQSSIVNQPTSDEVNDLFSQPVELSGIIDDVRRSIFAVECGDSTGTGWVLTTGGTPLIVTNQHVVSECIGGVPPRILIDGADLTATIVGSDEYTDLAVLKTTRQLIGLPTESPPPVGSWLMVIGNPIGLDRSINYGTLTNIAEGLIITDAAINPGNSGGPVFNSRGQVIGVASAKLVAEGIDRIGLVIPLSALCLQVLQCEDGQWD